MVKHGWKDLPVETQTQIRVKFKERTSYYKEIMDVSVGCPIKNRKCSFCKQEVDCKTLSVRESWQKDINRFQLRFHVECYLNHSDVISQVTT